MRVRGLVNGVWTDEATPTDAPKKDDGPYKMVNGSAHVRCGSCGAWTPAWGVETGVVGHWSWIDNPRYGKFNPKLGGIDDRERIRVVKMRRAELCGTCAWDWSLKRASYSSTEAVCIPDELERSRS